MKRTTEAIGLSERTVRDIPKRACCPQWPTFDPCQEIHSISDTKEVGYFLQGSHPYSCMPFYIRREYPTIAVELEKAKGECGFPGGRFCLWRVLKGMRFTYKKRDNKNTYTNRQTYWNKDTHTYRLYPY